jgi:histidinol-phosphate/aromatic aminotransferase/cobyric acid decarboxylase-like protein
MISNQDVYDLKKDKTQQYHGGQEWNQLDNFLEDFSVTTNGLGTPEDALNAAKDALNHIDHYPPSSQEPAYSSLENFLFPNISKEKKKRTLILGNGASELIDLVIRASPEGSWSGGPFDVQYKEYERAATFNGRKIMGKSDGSPESASIYSIVNPNNPTGDYLSIGKLKQWIESLPDNCSVTVDESMQIWVGDDWRNDSLVSQSKWIEEMWEKRSIAVFIIHSWTKIWSCTGIRLGSLVCPNIEYFEKIRKMQIPWSVNVVALAFLDQVVKNNNYLKKTWDVTSKWRKYAVDEINCLFPQFVVRGKPFLSWIWIDVGSALVAERLVEISKKIGLPIRWGKYGYEKETFVRVAVRDFSLTDVLLSGWREQLSQ